MLRIIYVTRIYKGYFGSGVDPLAEVCFSSIRGIQPQLTTTCRCSSKVIDQSAPVCTQPCPVSHDALSVKSYPHLFLIYLN